MGSGAIIGAAVGCGAALALVIAFIMVRHRLKRKQNETERVPARVGRSPTTSSALSFSEAAIASSSSKSCLLLPRGSLIQPDAPSSGCESPYPSQCLFPFNYQRKLSSYSSCTGYSAYSNDTCKSNDSYLNSSPVRIALQYRLYYDLDNGDLILHILQVHFTPTGQVLGSEGPLLSSPDRQRASPYRDTYVTFSLRAPGRERRCGQTKVSRADNYQQTVTYDEVFALPVNYEALSEQRLHFDIFFYNNYSRPQTLGSADTLLDKDVLDNTERWIDLAQAHVQASPNSEYLREISQVNGSARSEILVFLSFYIAKEELTVDILKAKNVTGLFPVRAQSETDTEVYIKTCLIIDEEKIKRRSISQSLQRATNATVVWNESLSYPVKYSQLEQCVLLLYVVEHRKETQKEKTVGKCVIGPFGGASSAGYLQWQQQGSSSVIRSNAMWHTVVRYSTNKKQPEEKSAS